MTMKAAIFTNYSDEDFVGVFDRVEYPIDAKATMMFEGPLAVHFAKQLAQRELNNRDIACSKANIEREGMKALKSVETKGADKRQVATEVLNYNSMKKDELIEEAKKKGVEVDASAKKADLIKDLEEFEDKG